MAGCSKTHELLLSVLAYRTRAKLKTSTSGQVNVPKRYFLSFQVAFILREFGLQSACDVIEQVAQTSDLIGSWLLSVLEFVLTPVTPWLRKSR